MGIILPETEVYIASAGKWLAAATLAAVVDEGKLSWDDNVNKWLPEFTRCERNSHIASTLFAYFRLS